MDKTDKNNRNKNIYFNRFNVRVCSFAVAIMLIGVGFFVSGINERKRLERENAAVYSRAFSELVTNICSINTSLEKMMYVTSPEQIFAVSSDLFRQVGFAKSDIGQLPLNNIDLSNMQTFLAQSGDYVYNLAQKAIKNYEITAEEQENLYILWEYSAKLAEQLAAMRDGINKSDKSDAVLKIIRTDLNSGNIPKLSNFSEVAQIFSDYPHLIYDGPFSANIKDLPYKMLENKKEITAAEAKTKAAAFCGVSESKLKSRGTTESFINTFNFEYENKFIQVSEKGGYVVNYLADRKVKDQLMSDGDALNSARSFINEIIPQVNIKETYYVTENGMMTINFAASQDGATLYPDLIKVGVALDNCEVLFYEATGYLQNHTHRNLPENIISQNEAAKAVSPLLHINSSGLAVILTESKNEVYCYEFKCTNANGKEYLVYVNAGTGRQENMLVIIDTGRGKLVM